jgi:hypothetical protein
MNSVQKCMMAGCLLLLPAFLFAQDQVLYKLPAGPDGPGAFGAYYTIYPDATGVRAITVHSRNIYARAARAGKSAERRAGVMKRACIGH